MSFNAKSEGAQDMTITSVQTPWSIENGIDWISLSSKSGESNATVSVNVGENTSGDDARIGVFYVKGNVPDFDYKTAISVAQTAAVPYVGLPYSQLNVSGAASSYELPIESNFAWELYSSENWLVATKNGNTLVLSVSSNNTGSYRTGIVTFLREEVATIYNIEVKQAIATITASTESISFENVASSVDITVNSETDWTAYSYDSWIDVAPNSGTAGTSTLKVSVPANSSINERNGYVVLSLHGIDKIQIPVRQKGIYVEVDKNSLDFAASGETQSIAISSNTSWSITDCPTWLTLSQTNGDGNATVTITASDNPNTSSRSATINVTQEGLSIKNAITVVQKGKSFDLSTSSLSFSDNASTQSLNIETDGAWTATTNDSWITLSPTSGSGNSTLSVSVTENTSDNERNGSISVTMGDKTINVSVVQTGKYLTIANDLLTCGSTGGTIEISVTTNDSWTAKVEDEASWVTLSPTSGKETAAIVATVYDNPSVNSRSTYVLIETSNNQSVRVMIKQDARYLTVDCSSLSFYSNGGTSEPITISTDGTYSVTCEEEWLTINNSSNTFTVTATENKTVDVRTGVVTIALTDLKEGTYSLSLNVIQLNKGGSFILQGFGDDNNYDSKNNDGANLTITGYGDDKNYDSSASKTVSITVSGYSSDSSLDTDTSSVVAISRTGYKDDTNIDKSQESSGNIERNGYNNDTDLE
jgi:hypothetical protein